MTAKPTKPTKSTGSVKRTCIECGASFSVHPRTIRRGYGRFCSATCRSVGTICAPVKIRNKTHHSSVAAAHANGVAASTVSWHLARGNPDKIGIGRGRWKRDENARLKSAKPFRLGQKEWPSQKAAREDLGLSAWTFWKYVKGGRTDLLMAAAMKMEATRDVTNSRQKKATAA